MSSQIFHATIINIDSLTSKIDLAKLRIALGRLLIACDRSN